MKLPRRQFLHLAASAAALPAVSRIAWAQAYPSRPVRLIVRSTWQAAPQHHRRTVLKWPPASSVVTIAKVRIHWRDAGYFQFSQMPAWAF
jgi:hypothetical protein